MTPVGPQGYREDENELLIDLEEYQQTADKVSPDLPNFGSFEWIRFAFANWLFLIILIYPR